MSMTRKLKRFDEIKNKKTVRKVGQLQKDIMELEKKLNDETDQQLTATERKIIVDELNGLYAQRMDLIFKMKMPKDFGEQVKLDIK